MTHSGNLSTAPFSPAPETAATMSFEGTAQLAAVRRFVSDQATRAGLQADRVEDLVLAVSELATNSLRHGGGKGIVRVWAADASVVCEVSDDGTITGQPLGGEQTDKNAGSGRGLWLVQQASDVMEQRSIDNSLVTRITFLDGPHVLSNEHDTHQT